MKRRIDSINDEKFDVVIIGAGIHGAALAWSCSRVGLKVCLIDKNDFGSGVSANSQKLIHGGLRYLKDFDLIRAIQSKNERKRLMQVAPHLVEPRMCFLPFYNQGLNRKSILWAGLKAFDILSYDRNFNIDTSKKIESSRIIDKQNTLGLFPFVPEKNLRGSAVWFDSFCLNTERLLLSYIKTAANKKAIVLNYVEALNYNSNGDKIKSVEVKDKITGNNYEIQAEFVINSTGLKSYQLFGENSSLKQEWMGGINLLMPRLFENKNTIGLQSPGKDSRMYVATSWKDKTIIGTEWFSLNSPKFEVTEEMCSQFLDNFNKTYFGIELKIEDIHYIYSGVVPAQNGEALKKEIISNHLNHNISNLIDVIGVKYTTAADVAEKVTKNLASKFKFSWISKNLKPIIGGDIDNLNEFKEFMQSSWSHLFSFDIINEIIEDYGTEANNIFELAESLTERDSNSLDPVLIARVLYSIENEQAVRLSDVLYRRTSVAISKEISEDKIFKIAVIMKNKLNWSEGRFNQELEDIQSYIPSFKRKTELMN